MTDDERQDDDGRGVVVPFNPRRRRHASKPKPKPGDVARVSCYASRSWSGWDAMTSACWPCSTTTTPREAPSLARDRRVPAVEPFAACPCDSGADPSVPVRW